MKRRHFLGVSVVTPLGLGVWWPRRWRFITLHHSGGAYGDIELLQRVHRERQAHDPVDMVPYHFVIGNGNGMPLGEVIETRRWQLGLWGAHVSRSNLERNARGIGVCLIGNFEVATVPEAQYLAALQLVRRLSRDYAIPLENVALHGQTPGEQTLCPGRNFPRERFFSELSRRA